MLNLAIDSQAADWGGFSWSTWIPLGAPASAFRILPAIAGFYRVRAVNRSGLVYVGQTGRSLRERTRALAVHAYRSADSPPWNDPHTAAPGLWAYRLEEDLDYEISVTPSERDYPERQSKEDELLFRHRVAHESSTLCNHGRFHPLWDRPSNRAGRRAMQRRSDSDPNPAGGPSLTPVQLRGHPIDEDWLGLSWSPTRPLAAMEAPNVPGVYRLISDGAVVYLGESKSLRGRLRTHAQHRSDTLGSYVRMPGALDHHLAERECDLIGAHNLAHGPPAAQWSAR